MENNTTQKLFLEGLIDAIGFFVGGMLAFWLGRLLGFDLFAPGYDFGSMVAILMAGLGGGLGVGVARKWLRPLWLGRHD